MASSISVPCPKVSSFVKPKQTQKISFALPPSSKSCFSFGSSIKVPAFSGCQWHNEKKTMAFKARAKLNEVAAEKSSNSVPVVDMKSKAALPKEDDKSTGNKIPDVAAISAFMTQVSDLVKLVDSRDITELQLKQSDCELIIRKKEALQPPEQAPPVFMPQYMPHHAMFQTPFPAAAPTAPPAPSNPAPGEAEVFFKPFFFLGGFHFSDLQISNKILMLQQHHQQQHHHHLQSAITAAPPPSATTSTPPSSTTGEAPPKQVALAMDRLGQAARLIADIRLGADRLLEALFVASQPHQSSKPLHLFRQEDESMRQHLQDLRTVGKQLEESGVLNESLRSRSNSWGLHMPLVCPDGAVVAYAWKRQLAGQAGASAVDRTRLALKAFTDQKRRFFPHLDDEEDGEGTDTASKKHRNLPALAEDNQDNLSDCKTLSDVLTNMEKERPNLKVSTYERLDWLKRASSLPASANDNTMEAPKHNFHGTSILRPALQNVASMDKVAVIELFFPSIFRAVVSLHPAGSTDPDSVAFFSPDEGGSYMHSRGSSVYHVFRQITEHATVALQYFLGIRSKTALHSLLHWICSYQTLFTKVCNKCGRLLAMDRQSALILPPVHRPYRTLSVSKHSSTQSISSTLDQGSNAPEAYHIGCFSDNT